MVPLDIAGSMIKQSEEMEQIEDQSNKDPNLKNKFKCLDDNIKRLDKNMKKMF